MAEALRSKIDGKLAFWKGVGRQIFTRIVMAMNALQHCRWRCLHKETL